MLILFIPIGYWLLVFLTYIDLYGKCISLLCRLKGERTKKTFEPNGTPDSATPKAKSLECETCIMRYYTICPREFIGKQFEN